jgi:hypothetical protein
MTMPSASNTLYGNRGSAQFTITILLGHLQISPGLSVAWTVSMGATGAPCPSVERKASQHMQG